MILVLDVRASLRPCLLPPNVLRGTRRGFNNTRGVPIALVFTKKKLVRVDSCESCETDWPLGNLGWRLHWLRGSKYRRKGPKVFPMDDLKYPNLCWYPPWGSVDFDLAGERETLLSVVASTRDFVRLFNPIRYCSSRSVPDSHLLQYPEPSSSVYSSLSHIHAYLSIISRYYS